MHPPPLVPTDVRQRLRQLWTDAAGSSQNDWPTAGWNLAVSAKVTNWTISRDYGGRAADSADVLAGLIEVARGHLGIALILSQFQAAVTRISRSSNEKLLQNWLPRLARGEVLATVGLSHLTTSRQYQDRAAVQIRDADGQFIIDGETPWVTSAPAAELLVLGGTEESGSQWLLAVDMNTRGVEIAPRHNLMALTETCTCPVLFREVRINSESVIAGPAANVMTTTSTGGTGSLSTSALALGHAYHAIDALSEQPNPAGPLTDSIQWLQQSADDLWERLLAAACGQTGPNWTAETLRQETTSLALRSAQSLVAAARGAGFLQGHPAERIMREALFFLVWSCPQEVVGRMLREFSFQEFSQCRSPENDSAWPAST